MVRAGKLRRRVGLYEPARSRDDYGAMTESYALWKTVWAEVRFISGRELILSETVSNTTTAQFLIRYRDDVKEEMRVKYDSDYYNILVIEEIQTKRMLKLTASKIIN